MSSIPPEIHGYVVDLLHDEPETLKACCLVSKSWVPRTREHLFASIWFATKEDLELWKKAFPDSANSLGFYVRNLFISCPESIVAADAEEGGWIRVFSSVESLYLDNGQWYLNASTGSLAPFHTFASTLKSLRISPILFPCPQLFDLICSSPLLEDLSVAGSNKSSGDGTNPNLPPPDVPSTSPPLTGTLGLNVAEGMGGTVRQLLDLPNGLHFRGLKLSWDLKEDLRGVTELVEECSHTLELFHIACDTSCTSIWHPHHITSLLLSSDRLGPASIDLSEGSINLSGATRLKDLAFRYQSHEIGWIAEALGTITPQHGDLRRISIYLPFRLTVGINVRESVGEAIVRQWLDLDRLLVQFWESHSIRSRIGCMRLWEKRRNVEYYVGCLLPEAAKRGVVDLVEYTGLPDE